MVLSLRDIAASKIPVACKPDFKSKSVLENILIEYSTKLEKLETQRRELKIEYSETNHNYYDVLHSDEMSAEIYTCVDEMSRKHNEIIEFRNQMAFMRLWSNNYVLLDVVISKYIAWPSASAERQELLTLFYGIFSHHKDIVLNEPTETEQMLLTMIIHYVDRSRYWYDILSEETDAKNYVNLLQI